MYRPVLAPFIWLGWIALAAAQVPLTPGVGQYCSNYANGFTSNRGGGLDLSTLGPTYGIDCVSGCPYSQNICYGQATPACPWSQGAYCSPGSCDNCGDNCQNCGSEFQATSYCSSGCVTVSPCTPVSNAVFTAAATPITSATGCPFTCSAGYTLSGSTCAPLCSGNTYYNGGTCSPCTSCSAGHYNSGCGGTSPGTCVCSGSTYNNGTACVPCPLCLNGFYLQGCGGASPGACQRCTNS